MQHIFHDIYLYGHMLHGGKSSTIDENSDPLSISNKSYVDLSHVFDSALLNDNTVELTPISRITNKSALQGGLTIHQIFDKLFFPVVAPKYAIPVLDDDASIQLVDVLTDEPISQSDVIEIGTQLYGAGDENVTFNDSAGIDETTVTILDQNDVDILSETFDQTETFSTTQFTARKQNKLQVAYTCLGAALKQDTHGDDNASGQFGSTDVNITADTITTYWPKFVSFFDSTYDIGDFDLTGSLLRNSFTNEAADELKILDVDENSLETTVWLNTIWLNQGNDIQHVAVALPNIGDINDRQLQLMINDEDVSSFLTSKTNVTGVHDASGNTSVSDYTVYLFDLEIPLTGELQISIKTFNFHIV